MTTTDSMADTNGSWRNWFGRHLRLEGQDKFEIYSSVATSATLRDATYWAEILFSAGIATLGLTLGSPAVIIGAMLISPLMGPIMAGGLALAAGDFLLATRATINIILSSLAAILFSTLLVILLPFREMTAEIASRTHPNTLDLVVALFSGAVGAIAVCKSLRSVATSIPGVAIAVALMPPLCVSGYGIGMLLTVDRVQGLSILRGGGMLFMTNLVAITFSSMLVFLLLNIDSAAVRDRIRDWRGEDPDTARIQRFVESVTPESVRRIGSLPARLLLVAGLVVMIFVPLKRSFDALSVEIRERQQLNRTNRAATSAWQDLFGRTRGGAARSYVDWLDSAERDGKLALTVRAFISESITPEERQAYARTVARELGRPPETVELSVIEIPTSTYQVAKAKKEAEATPSPAPETLGMRLGRAGQEALAKIGTTNLPPGVIPIGQAITLGSGAPVATITYLGSTPISEDAHALIATRLREQLDLPRLDLRLVLVPAQTSLAFASRSKTLDDAASAAADRLAATLRERPGLRVIVLARESGGIAAERATAVRDALIARGAPEPAIAMTASDTVPADEVVVVIEKPAPL